MNVPSLFDAGTSRHAGIATALVVLVTVLVGVSWLPSLLGPLGDNHEGRIYGMVALQVSNLWESGWSASQWGTSRAPFAAAYSHHPPGFSLWYVPAWLLPGDPSTWIRVLPYALGLAFLPATHAVLRRLHVRPMASATAVGVVGATPLYWVYGRIWPALGLVALLALAVVDLRDGRRVSRRRLVVVCAIAAFTVLANWFAMGGAALLGLWLLAGRGLDRVTMAMGTVMAAAAAITFGWVVLAPDTVEFGDQVVVRTAGGEFTTAEFLERMWRWVDELLPVWLWAPGTLGVLVALADLRARLLAAVSVVLGVGWVAAFPNGAWVHDYWITSLLVPLVIGLALLLDRMLAARPTALAAIGTVAVVGATALLWRSDVPATYVNEPQDAGELVASVPPPGQQRGWVGRGIAEPTWLGYAWEVPVTILREPSDVAPVADDDLVLLELDRMPAWMDHRAVTSGDVVLAREGGYALVRGRVVQEATTTTAG